MPKHSAPVLASELHRALSEGGCPIRPAKSGGCVALVCGVEIRIPALGQRKAEVSHDTMKKIAAAIGCGVAEVLDVLFGRVSVAGGKPKVVAVAEDVSKADALGGNADLLRRVRGLHGWLTAGQHSPATYKRILAATTKALDVLSDCPTSPEGYESPDDAGYRPTQFDSVTTGSARVTGITASTAVRRTTITKHQHNERSAS